MMEKWAKIEYLINELLTKVLTFLASKRKKLIPIKVLHKFQKIKNSVLEFYRKIFNNLKAKMLILIVYFKNFPKKLLEIKDKILIFIAKISQYFKNFDKKDLKKIYLTLKIDLSFLKKIKISKKTLYWGSSGIALLGIFSIAIFPNIKKIAKNYFPTIEENISLNEEKSINRRPAYYKKNEKQFLMRNIIVPISFINSKKEIKKVDINVSLTSSNRYIKEFFFEHPYYIHDRINQSIAPIYGEFILKKEGKEIIKEKIKEELNRLIKELKIAGTIEEVYIDSIVAGS